MLEFNEAQARLVNIASRPGKPELRPLSDLPGRVLAEDVRATLDLPPHDNSAMDGYAIRAQDLDGPDTRLPIQQRCYAGENPAALRPGHATRLFTGSLIPQGADTVVVQEDCTEDETGVIVHLPEVPVGQHIRYRGDDMRRDEIVVSRGTRLNAAHVGVLAAQGHATAATFPLLRIGILTTGDELLEPGQPLTPAAIYNSNAPMLIGLCRSLGAAPPLRRHAPDDARAIEDALSSLQRECDLVLSVGGASVGEKDLVKPAIAALGGTLDLWRVRMKPGKPVALAQLDGTPMVCLPGNPVSAFVVFALLVSPLIRAMQGCRVLFPPVRKGILHSDRPHGGQRDDFLRVRVHPHHEGLPELVPHPQQSSGALSSLPWADGLARVPAGEQAVQGHVLDWYDLKEWLS